MRYSERRNGQPVAQPHGFLVCQCVQVDIFEAHQLIPWPVCCQVFVHAWHCENVDTAGSRRLASEMYQPGVMTHVRVREKNAAKRVFTIGCCQV